MKETVRSNGKFPWILPQLAVKPLISSAVVPRTATSLVGAPDPPFILYGIAMRKNPRGGNFEIWSPTFSTANWWLPKTIRCATKSGMASPASKLRQSIPYPLTLRLSKIHFAASPLNPNQDFYHSWSWRKYNEVIAKRFAWVGHLCNILWFHDFSWGKSIIT